MKDISDRTESNFGRLALDELLRALQRLDRLLEQAVDAAQLAYGQEAAADKHRGLYIDRDEVERLLSHQLGAPILWAKTDGHEESLSNLSSNFQRLAWLQKAFGISPFELNLILIALAPEIDLRYERLYAYLQDDVTRKRPTVDLALNLLCPDTATKLERRAHFAPNAPLIWHELLHLIPDPHQVQPPLLSHYFKLDEQITRFLLGQPGLDTRLAAWCELIEPRVHLDSLLLTSQIKQGLWSLALQARKTGQPLLLYFQGPKGLGQGPTAEALAAEIGSPLLTVNLVKALEPKIDFESFLKLLWREAQFQKAILYVEELDVLRNREHTTLYQQLMATISPEQGILSSLSVRAPCLKKSPLSEIPLSRGKELGVKTQEDHSRNLNITILAGTQPWLADGSNPAGAIVVPFTTPDFTKRQTCWQANLTAMGIAISAHDLNALADRFRLTSEQIANAVVMARNQSLWRAAAQSTMNHQTGFPLQLDQSMIQPTVADLFAAVRAQAGQALATLARQIEPKFCWSDIVLPPDRLTQLREICNQAKNRQVVYGKWGFERKLSLGKGLNALFSGQPGTGKTMAAEVIANELQLDLYKIDLSQVVSKYIGETEKNLDHIFTAAENANAILLFDEADALFGKRSEVKDAHDRYANLEIAYLLQKMEEYEGITILTTNLRQNLDEAFTRRIRFIVEFPFPEEEYRLQIWLGIWPPETPLEAEVALDLLAQKFKLAGGNIRNIALAAAFLAAAENQCLGLQHLLQATKREFQKMGRLIDEEVFSSFVKTDGQN